MNIQPTEPQVSMNSRYTLVQVQALTGISPNTIRAIRDELYPAWRLEHANDKHPYYKGNQVVAIWRRF